MSYTFMKQFAGYLPKDLYFPGLAYLAGPAPAEASPKARAAIKRFYDAMKAANATVEFSSGVAWDPAAIIVDAYRKLGTSATYDQIRTWILSQTDYAGISGVYDFTDKGAGAQRGLTQKDVLIMRWDDTKWTPSSKMGGGL
jgi:hypothetical protein